MTEISQNIRRFRKRQGLSQSALAERLSVTRQTVSNWETDKSYPDLDMVVRLSGVLQTTPNDLLYPSGRERGTHYRPVSFRAVLFTLAAGFLTLTFGAGLADMVFRPILGGGVAESFLYPIYAGIILLAGLVVGCTCVVLDELRNRAYYAEEADAQETDFLS